VKARPSLHEELEKLLLIGGKQLHFLHYHSQPTHFHPSAAAETPAKRRPKY